MKALIPNTFRNGGLDAEQVNENLRALQRDTNRNLDRRYTYCSVAIPLDGLQNTDTAAERTIRFGRPLLASLPFPVDIVGMELSIYAAGTETWSVAATDENGTVLDLSATAAGATTEAYDSTNAPLQLDTNTDIDFVLSATGSSTITRGTLTLSLRCDRLQMGATALLRYDPTLVDASVSVDGTELNTELGLAEDAVELDAAAFIDLRCTCLLARDFSAARTWALPSGANNTGLYSRFVVVGTAADQVAFNDGTSTVTVIATGTSDIVEDFGSLIPHSKSDDPTNTGNDLTMTLTPTTGTAINVAYCFLWWS